MEIIYSRYEKEAKTSKLRKLIAEYHMEMVYRRNVDQARKEFKGERYPLPLSVEVETINRCNNDCSFCPVNRNEKQRELCRMTEETLDKILDELSGIGYTGILQLFSNNEPLLDKDIYTRVRKAKDKVPGAYMLLMTNGILIDINKIGEMLDSLDMLVIDNYDDGLEMIPSVQKFYGWIKEHTEYEDKVEIHMRKKNEVLTSRGGV